MKILILQANFLPWSSYFSRMAQCDLLVLLDSAPFIKGNYHNRTKIKKGEKDQWLTVPVEHVKNLCPMNEQPLSRHEGSPVDFIKKRLKSEYKKAGTLIDYMFSNLSDCNTLFELNFALIRRFKEHLNIKTEIDLSSTVRNLDQYDSCGKFIQICKYYGATTYCYTENPPYILLESFESASIKHEKLPSLPCSGLSLVHELLSSCYKQKDIS